MEAKAIGKRIRISAQKVRRIADLVRGKPVAVALDLLSFEAQQPAGLVKKVLENRPSQTRRTTRALMWTI